jgi:L-ascorbate metabolism protein UlaG (beta-lactamase superfamily)
MSVATTGATIARPDRRFHGRRYAARRARNVVIFMASVASATSARAADGFETDTIPSPAGDLRMTFVGHGTLFFQYSGKVIHVDPVGRYADYTKMPKADLILVTHEHGDHLDAEAIAAISTEKTLLVVTKICHDKLGKGVVMANGERREILGFAIEAVPAYNIVHMREGKTPFHLKGDGNGYVITFGKTRVYVAGDTENTPEMKALRDIDIAFLPMNLPYTMTPEMVADAARAFEPRVLYPYHYGKTDPAMLVALLNDATGIEVRIRKLE